MPAPPGGAYFPGIAGDGDASQIHRIPAALCVVRRYTGTAEELGNRRQRHGAFMAAPA